MTDDTKCRCADDGYPPSPHLPGCPHVTPEEAEAREAVMSLFYEHGMYPDVLLDAYRDAIRGSLREQCRAVFEAYVDARRAYREAEPFTEAHWNELSQFDRAFEAVYDFLHENPAIDVDDAIRHSDKERNAALEAGLAKILRGDHAQKAHNDRTGLKLCIAAHHFALDTARALLAEAPVAHAESRDEDAT